MGKTAAVSVIVPAYNVESSLRHCLDSVLAQSLKPDEVIVINDGSEDATGDVARSYDDAIVYLEQDNLGQGAARNRGLEVASGQYVTFLDADDYWMPDFLEDCVSFLESNHEVVAVFTAWRKDRRNGSSEIRPPVAAHPEMQRKGPQVLESFYRFWAEHHHVQTGAVVIRSEVVHRIGGMRADLRISQDLEYWAHIANHGEWGFIPKVLLVNSSECGVPKGGWIKKYAKRRRLCPTVKQWEERILPCLEEENVPYFKVIRGRVAAGYLHAKISAGDYTGARKLVEEYGNDMPATSLMNWAMRAAQLGWAPWRLFCAAVRLREAAKILT